MISMMFRSFYSNDHRFLTNVYKCYIRPILESASPVWNPTDVNCTNIIEKVQRSFTKRLFFRSGLQQNLSYEDRLEILGLDTLENRRNISDVIFLHKCIHNHFIFEKNNLYKISPLGRPLRNSHSLRITLPFQIASSLNTFVSRHINYWNTLSQEKVSLQPETFGKFLRSLPPNTINAVSLIR